MWTAVEYRCSFPHSRQIVWSMDARLLDCNMHFCWTFANMVLVSLLLLICRHVIFLTSTISAILKTCDYILTNFFNFNQQRYLSWSSCHQNNLSIISHTCTSTLDQRYLQTTKQHLLYVASLIQPQMQHTKQNLSLACPISCSLPNTLLYSLHPLNQASLSQAPSCDVG